MEGAKGEGVWLPSPPGGVGKRGTIGEKMHTIHTHTRNRGPREKTKRNEKKKVEMVRT